MPYKDKKKQQQWYKDKISRGYGKVLWLRRKQVYENEKNYRAALEAIRRGEDFRGEYDPVSIAGNAIETADGAAHLIEKEHDSWKASS